MKTYDDIEKCFKHLMQNMYCGWELPHDSGWNDIIYKLLCKIDRPDTELQVVQVKEKFGGLRFYVDGGSEEDRKLIDFFEGMSCFICEKCGTTCDVTCTGNGWIKSLCDSCREEDTLG